MAADHVIAGTRGRPPPFWMHIVQPLAEFLRAPAVLASCGNEPGGNLGIQAMRAVMRCATAITQPGRTAEPGALQPLVARGPRNAEALAELRHRPLRAGDGGNKLLALGQRIGFHPGHLPGVNHAAGLLLTTYPAYTPPSPKPEAPSPSEMLAKKILDRREDLPRFRRDPLLAISRVMTDAHRA